MPGGCLPRRLSAISSCVKGEGTPAAHHLGDRSLDALPRTIDKASAEIIGLARRLHEPERMEQLQVPPPDMDHCDRLTMTVRDALMEEVQRLEHKLEKAECLEKDVEQGLKNDRSLLERIEETLMILAREETRLEWRHEEMKKRREVIDVISETRGRECVRRLRQEAERLRLIVADLERKANEEEQSCSGNCNGVGDLNTLKTSVDHETGLIHQTLDSLRDEKNKQLARAKELRAQIFDDRRRLDLMLEKHIHLVQEINRLKTRYHL